MLLGRCTVSQPQILELLIESRWPTLTLLDEILKDAATSRVGDATLSQPLSTAVQIALVDLLASWNVLPTQVTGHSSGEIAAAYCAGALSRENAMAIAFYRGIVASKLRKTRSGAMLAVGLSAEETRPLIKLLRRGSVMVACINSPSSVTISGDKEAILELAEILKERGTFSRELAVEIAYHSHHMEDVASDYLAALQDISVEDGGQIDFHSSVTGKLLAHSELTRDYWVSNMVSPVHFTDSLRSLLLHGNPDSTVEILLEIGPHSALQSPIKQILQQDPDSSAARVQYRPSLVRNRSAVQTCHELVVFLFKEGVSINLNNVNSVFGHRPGRLLSGLPQYPWNHSKSYWTERTKVFDTARQNHSRSDLLGVRIEDSISREPRWRNIVRPTEIPWLNDHVVQSSTLYPAAGFLAMAIEAEHQMARTRCDNIMGYQLREISIDHALIIPQGTEDVETLVSLRPYNESILAPFSVWNEFSIQSSTDGSSWTENCHGLISIQRTVQQTEVDGGRQALDESKRFCSTITSFETDCVTPIDSKEMYKSLDRLGLKFGPTFTNLQNIRVAANRCLAEVTVPDTAAVMPAHFEYPYVIHPAFLDSCLHTIFPIDARYDKPEEGTPVPTFIQELFVSQSIMTDRGQTYSVYSQKGTKAVGSEVNTSLDRNAGSFALFDKVNTDFKPKVLMNGLVFKLLPNTSHRAPTEEEPRICYRVDWQPDPNLLSSAQAAETSTAFRKPFAQPSHALLSQQAAFYYVERVLEIISSEEVAKMQPHHQKLYNVLVNFCKDVYAGRLGRFSTFDWPRLEPEQRVAICQNIGQTPYGILLQPIGDNISQILLQEVDPLSLMVENDRLEAYYRCWEPIKQSYEQAAVFMKLLGSKNPHLNILEIGAGTAGATLPILEALSGEHESPPMIVNYDFTDISPAFFQKAAGKLERWSGIVTFKKLDIEEDPIQQGFSPNSYDLIVAANVVHATSCIEYTMKHVRELLKPGGTVILIEITVNTMGASLIFGTLPGWWNGTFELFRL